MTSNDARRAHFADTLSKMGWTHEEVASKLNVNVRTVRRYLSGETPVPPLVTFYCKAVSLPKKVEKLAKLAAEKGVNAI